MGRSSSFTDLPTEIIANILCRLPILFIEDFKSVCRQWLAIFESPEFTRLHLSNSAAGLLVFQHLAGSYLIKIFGIEDDPEFERHEFNYTPVREYELTKFKCHTIAGSVDCFLCLRHAGQIENLYVCNPITREYISLPALEGPFWSPSVVTYGFGVSSTTSRQYKVVQIFHESELDLKGVCIRIPRSECRVYTLGTTGAWRSIEPSPPLYYNRDSIGACLNGSLHWLAGDLKDSYLISCLNLDTELFKTISAPPLPGYRSNCMASLVVLGDCLSVCDNTSQNDIVIWVMKDYGDGKSWTKELVISKLPNLDGECSELVLPIKKFRNGDVLMIWGDFCMFCYSNKNKTFSKVEIVVMACCGTTEAMLHVPGLVSLNCFVGENVESF